MAQNSLATSTFTLLEYEKNRKLTWHLEECEIKKKKE